MEVVHLAKIKGRNIRRFVIVLKVVKWQGEWRRWGRLEIIGSSGKISYMSLPYIKCPKCGERNSSPSEESYFQCSSCGYLEPKGSIILEENKDYEEEREKRVEVREEELRKWEEEREELCREVIKDLLPNQKVEVSFFDYLPNS